MDRRSLLLTGAASLAACATRAPAAAATKANFDAAFDFSAQSGGDAMVVMQDGKFVYERYGPGRDPAKLNSIASATKSFWGPAGAVMIGEGVIKSWDEPAAETLTEWRSDPQKREITLRHLLSLTSGLGGDVEALQGQGTAPNKYATAIEAPVVNPPGSDFQYGPVNYYVFGEIVRRKLAGRYKDPLAYLKAKILQPLGIERYDWIHDPSGNPHVPNGCSIAARDWIRFGEMVRQGGRWNGRQLVPEAPLRECFRPAPANKAYGLTFWLNQPGGSVLGERAPPGSPGGGLLPQAHPDLVAPLGAGRNGLYMVPAQRMVIVRQRPYTERQPGITWQQHARRSREWMGDFTDRRFLALALGLPA